MMKLIKSLLEKVEAVIFNKSENAADELLEFAETFNKVDNKVRRKQGSLEKCKM